ncbi:MAG: trypsin-like peptidase domain-containing protein [Bryobacteraceae bacterium]|nr:trypsin-like peptidase domain-containing protein [Bryobacteraceae bacterium]
MAAPNFGEIGEGLRRSTVSIASQQRGQAGNGSGVIWSADGLIVTNAHVVRGEQLTVDLWDGTRLPATLLKLDPKRDVATLRVEATDLPAAATANAQDLRAGELVIAVGHPLGFHGALSTGVIHRIGPFRGMGTLAWVQADVRLAPGNSGGPLADAEGRVIGINTAIAAGGLGLAVPTEAVRRFIRMGPESASLGVSIHATRMRLDQRDSVGYVVLEVTPGSAAHHASLMPGDVLIGTAERWFTHPRDLGDALDSGAASLKLRFLRGERRRWREVVVQLRQPQQEAA